MFRLIFVLGCFLLAPMACATPGPSGDSPAKDIQSNTHADARGTASPEAASDILILWDGLAPEGQSVALVDATSGRLQARLPYGVVNQDRSLLYTATPSEDGSTTTVEAFKLPSGQVLSSMTLEGSFKLTGKTALAPDEGLLVLTRQSNPEKVQIRESTFALVETSLEGQPRIVTLTGNFAVDALSANGEYLYLIEHLPPAGSGSYQVRVYDLTEGQLLSQALRDGGDRVKEVVTTMSGTALQQVVSEDGRWVYSLYINLRQGPFIHALNMAERRAYCIFLPYTHEDDLSRQLFWSISLTTDGQRLYAANGALGIVREYDFSSQSDRTANLKPTEDALFDTAQGTRVEPQPTTQTAYADLATRGAAALSSDERLLYILGEGGIYVIETGTLDQQKYFPVDREVHHIVASRDEKLLYAVVPNGDPGVLVIDISTGKLLRTLEEKTIRPFQILGTF